MNHDLGAPLPRGRIVLATRELPAGPRGERRYFGNLQGRDWSVNVQLSVGRTLETVPLLLGAIRILTLAGSLDRDQYARITRYIEGIARGDAAVAGNAAWNTYNKIIEHPGTSAILSALSAIPGAGQFTSTAFLAAKAVGAIGNDLTTARRKRKQSGYTAAGVASAANQALAASKKAVRLTPEDIERAVRAYFAMQTPAKGRARINFLIQKPLSQNSEEYRELLALQFAEREGPAIELTSDSLDPMVMDEVSGPPDAPCRCHVWSDTAGELGGFDDSIGVDDLLAGAGDRVEDLVDIPDVPEHSQTAGALEMNDVAGPDDDLALQDDVAGPLDFNDVAGPEALQDDVGGPAESLELAGPGELAGPLSAFGGAELAGPLSAFDGAELAGPLDGDTAGGMPFEAQGHDLDNDVSGPAESLANLGGPLDTGDFAGGHPLEPDLTPIAGPPPEPDLNSFDEIAPDMSGAPEELDFGDGLGDPFGHRPGAFIGADFEPWTYAPE